MNTDETQIKREKDYSLSPITEQLIGADFEVHNVLGYGFLERVYQRAMQVELQFREGKGRVYTAGLLKKSVFHLCISVAK
jgi:PD-(D/E)XK nuclease superfamily